MTRPFFACGLALLAVSLAPLRAAGAQPALSDVSVLSPLLGDATVPSVSAEGVAFRDYRGGSYGIHYVDLTTGLERRLAPVFFAEPGVATSGGRVAWVGYPGGTQADVYVHTLASGVTTRITTDAAFQNHVRLHGDLLVWQDFRNAGASGTNADIYVRDLAGGTTSALVTHPALQDLPAVWDRRVVWQDYRHASAFEAADIYVRDVDGGPERRLTTGTAYRTHPAIWEHRVVWEDYRNGPNGDIYLLDLDTGEVRAVCVDPAHQTQPQVFGDWVVWLDYRNGSQQGDLYGFHLGTGQEHALLVHPAHQEPPRIFGHTLVWQDYRAGRLDLYRGRLSAFPVSADAPPSGPAAVQAYPNPFRDQATLRLPPSSAATEVEIFDVRGRRVRRLLVTGDRVVWAGIDDAGARVPDGLYLVRAAGQTFPLVRAR